MRYSLKCHHDVLSAGTRDGAGKATGRWLRKQPAGNGGWELFVDPFVTL